MENIINNQNTLSFYRIVRMTKNDIYFIKLNNKKMNIIYQNNLINQIL